MFEHVCMYTKYTCIHASAFVLWDVVCLSMSSVMYLPCCAICSMNFFPSVSCAKIRVLVVLQG